MSIYICVVAILLFLIAFLVGLLRFAFKERRTENENKQKERTELKEKMDTGNSRSDFDASLDVLHQLSKK